MASRRVPRATKTWSFQASTALAALLGMEQALPQLAAYLPDGVFAGATLLLAGATPVLRSISQPKLHPRKEEADNGSV